MANHCHDREKYAQITGQGGTRDNSIRLSLSKLSTHSGRTMAMNPDYREALRMAVSIAEQGEPTETTIERAREFLAFMKGEMITTFVGGTYTVSGSGGCASR